MTKRPAKSKGHLFALIASLHVEIAILVFCVLIYLGAGSTRGPVFDVIGPEMLPTATSVLVGGLVMMQIVLQVRRSWRDPLPPVHLDPVILRNLAVFTGSTILFVVAVAQGWLPFALATCGFITVTTMLLSNRIDKRDAMIGAVSGLALGVVLQVTFTYVLFVDLPG